MDNAFGCEAVVIGGSSGGLNALKKILSGLPEQLPMAIVVVLHIAPGSRSYLPALLAQQAKLPVLSVDDKQSLQPGNIYIAPPGYHLFIERDRCFALSVDDRVNFAIPSIDVLFESAADVYRERLIGILLTGANHDGALGLKRIEQYGGAIAVQAPETAESSQMPLAGLRQTKAALSLALDEMAPFIVNHVQHKGTL